MKKKLKLKEITEKISEDTGLKEYEVKSVVISMIKYIATELANGRSVYLLSLGKFWLKHMAPQKGWDPRRLERMDLKDRFIPKFSFSNRLYYFIRDEASKKLRDEL